MISFLRTIFTIATAFLVATVLGLIPIIAGLFGVEDKPDGIYDKIPRWWSRSVMWAAGIKVRVHGLENDDAAEPRVSAPNHVSWFDVAGVARGLSRHKFVAQAGRFKSPIFRRRR